MEEHWQAQVTENLINQEIIDLAMQFGLEPYELVAILSEWAMWQADTFSWIYVNRN